MKHSKANTIPYPVFVNNKGLHGLTPLLDDTELSKVCGGLKIEGFAPVQLLIPFVGLSGIFPDNSWYWYPGALLTSIPLVTALIALPAYISHKVTKKKYEKKLKENRDVEL